MKTEAGDYKGAMELQFRGNKVIETLGSFGYGGALRRAAGLLGVPCGEPRMPDTPFPDGQLEDLKKALASVDFDELSSL
jgi:dihydrodipicolinate synthase/N-acetylneuraminate lyase